MGAGIPDLINGEVPTTGANVSTINEQVVQTALLNGINLNISAMAIGLGVVIPGIIRQNEVAVTTKTEVDVAFTSYIVPAGKKFVLTSFIGSYDVQATLFIRLKKQTNSTGAFNLVSKITLMVGGQGQSIFQTNFGTGILIGAANDTFKITVEASLAKGNVWTGFYGVEL